MLPGEGYPPDWKPSWLWEGYNVRFDGEFYYLVFGSEEIVAQVSKDSPLIRESLIKKMRSHQEFRENWAKMVSR